MKFDDRHIHLLLFLASKNKLDQFLKLLDLDNVINDIGLMCQIPWEEYSDNWYELYKEYLDGEDNIKQESYTYYVDESTLDRIQSDDDPSKYMCMITEKNPTRFRKYKITISIGD